MSDPSKLKGFEWEVDLPSLKDLTPLTQSLITPELAFAFGLNPEPPRPMRPMIDLNVAVHTTCSTNCPKDDNLKRVYTCEPNESNSGSKDDIADEFGLNRALKRPRLVWTPQLHKRFVDVIEHLGVDKAVPKTIMEMMSVEGLTRENVASHLQKYRLYMKRMDGFSGGPHSGLRRAPSLFECEEFTIEPQPQQSVHCSGLPLMPMPVVGPPSGSYGFGHLGLPVGNSACGVEYGEYNFWNRH